MYFRKIIAFIGAGNMASALIKGIIKKNIITAAQINIYDIDAAKTSELTNSLKVNPYDNIKEAVENSDVVFLCVKPDKMESVLNEIKDLITDEKCIVSIAAAWSASRIKKTAGQNKKVLRLMPNTPLLAGEGMTVFETPSNINKDDYAFIKSIFNALGQTAEAKEENMHAVTAVSGSGPAYAYLLIDAMAKGGERLGLSGELSLELAAQTVLGAAKMVKETKKAPSALKDAVCSPGGTTIEAVKVMEDNGFDDIIYNAMGECAKKSGALSEQANV